MSPHTSLGKSSWQCIVRCASPESAKRLCSSVTAANDKRRGESNEDGADKHKSGHRHDISGKEPTTMRDVGAAEHTVWSQYIEMHS